MKRFKGLWSEVTRFDNLLLAYQKARKGKRRRAEVARFSLNMEGALFDLQRALLDETYCPGEYRLFTIYERKPRLIAAAPFVDRIVHHAIMNQLEPRLDRRFHFHSYACRKGKGVHAAVDRYQQWARQYAYLLKLDIRSYFPSIDHRILKAMLARHLKDAPLLRLLDRLIDGSPRQQGSPEFFPGDDLFTAAERPRGIPIGNLTSQFFANLYLNDFDQWVSGELKIPAYLRYVDDCFLFGDDLGELWAAKAACADYLEALRLRIHPVKAQVRRTREAIDVLGYKVSPHRRWLRNENGHRFRRKLEVFARAYAHGEASWSDFDPSVRSWIGHARHGETEGLQTAIFDHVVFRRSSVIS